MKHNHRLTLLLMVLGGVIGAVPATSAQPLAPDALVFALHVTIPPSWFDPAETPAQITPFGILYALHDAVLRPLPGSAWPPPSRPPGARAPMG